MPADKKMIEHIDAKDGQKSKRSGVETPVGVEVRREEGRKAKEVEGRREEDGKRRGVMAGVAADSEAVEGNACEWQSTLQSSSMPRNQEKEKPHVVFSRNVLVKELEIVEGPGTRGKRRVATGEVIGTTVQPLAKPNMDTPREPEELTQERIREILGDFHGAPPVNAFKPNHCRTTCKKGPCKPEACSCILGGVKCSIDAKCTCGPRNCGNYDDINPIRDVVKANDRWRKITMPDINDTIRSVDPIVETPEVEVARDAEGVEEVGELGESFAEMRTAIEDVLVEEEDRGVGVGEFNNGPEAVDRFVNKRRRIRRVVEDQTGSVGEMREQVPSREAGVIQRPPNNVQVRPSEVRHWLCYTCGIFIDTSREYQLHLLYHELMRVSHGLWQLEPLLRIEVTSSSGHAAQCLNAPFISIRRARKRSAEEGSADEPERKRRRMDGPILVEEEDVQGVVNVSVDDDEVLEEVEVGGSAIGSPIDQNIDVKRPDSRFVNIRRRRKVEDLIEEEGSGDSMLNEDDEEIVVDHGADMTAALEAPRFVSNLGEQISMDRLYIDEMPFADIGDDSIPDQLEEVLDFDGDDSGAGNDGVLSDDGEEEYDDDADAAAPATHSINLEDDGMGDELKKVLPTLLKDSDFKSCSKDNYITANALFCGMMQVASAPNRKGLKIGVLSPMVMKEWDMGMTMTKAEIDENLFNLDPQQVLIPIYQPSRMYENEMIEHWMVALYDVRGCSITIYDTIESTNDEKEVIIGLVNALMDEWIGEDESNCLRNRFARRDRVEKQTGSMNKANSGVFALLHARRLVQSEKDVSSRGRAPVDVEKERKQLLETMKAAAVDFEKLKQPATSSGTLQPQQQQHNQRKRKLQAVTTPDYIKARRDNSETREKIRRCCRELKKRC